MKNLLVGLSCYAFVACASTHDGVDTASQAITSGGVITSAPGVLSVSESHTSGTFSAAVSGDFDGDGNRDLAIADSSWDTSNTSANWGRVYVWYGPISSLSLSTAVTLSGQGAYTFGATMAAGDLNGDGKAELIVGANGTGATLSGSGQYTGSVFIFPGTSTRWSGNSNITISSSSTLPYSAIRLEGLNHEYVGNHLAVSDVDNDGYADLLVGSACFQTSTSTTAASSSCDTHGRVYLVYGSSSILSTTATELETVATSIKGAGATHQLSGVRNLGDINGDGYSEIALTASGANSSNGYSYIVYGSGTRFSGTTSSPLSITSIKGAEFRSVAPQSGCCALSAGDLNGDGNIDLAIGISDADNHIGTASTGAVFVKLGAGGTTPFSGITTLNATDTTSYSFMIGGKLAYDKLGSPAVVDFDGDGVSDLKINATGYGTTLSYNTGAVYVAKGPLSASNILATAIGSASTPGFSVLGTSTTANFGASAVIGDVTGDGKSDLICAQPGATPTTTTGKYYVLPGQSF